MICALNSQSTEFSLTKKYSVHGDRQRLTRAVRTDRIGREYLALKGLRIDLIHALSFFSEVKHRAKTD